jgi:hypothetical protein
LAAGALLAATPRSDFQDLLTQQLKADGDKTAQACGLTQYRGVVISDSLTYNEGEAFRKEKPEALLAAPRAVLAELAQACQQDAALKAAFAKKTVPVTSFAVSFRAPVEDAAQNGIRAGFNGSELQLKFAINRAVTELAPKGRVVEMVKARLR